MEGSEHSVNAGFLIRWQCFISMAMQRNHKSTVVAGCTATSTVKQPLAFLPSLKISVGMQSCAGGLHQNFNDQNNNNLTPL
jgi:hypothetical protein